MADSPAARLVALCFGAKDPLQLARFYAVALGWEIGGGSPDDVALVPTDSTRFVLRFRPTPEHKVGPNRLHLDLTTRTIHDQEQSVSLLLAAGGRHVDIGQREDETHVVLADPEGNELCIIAPGNNFLAGCERLGSITCDGTREVGYFWSAALGWPLVWDQDEETAIRAPDGTGPLITWGGPPVARKTGRNRLHLDIAPAAGVSREAEADRLTALGARRATDGSDSSDRSNGDDGFLMFDPDDNEFRIVEPSGDVGQNDDGLTDGPRRQG